MSIRITTSIVDDTMADNDRNDSLEVTFDSPLRREQIPVAVVAVANAASTLWEQTRPQALPF